MEKLRYLAFTSCSICGVRIVLALPTLTALVMSVAASMWACRVCALSFLPFSLGCTALRSGRVDARVA